ncbi:hypothetical protein MKW98_027204 [Papaver atlanticum]|uniref:J domain-containing protein required for chloroplast accumulation response 1 n=1 Tax=Papaver atlanticum TaxID=357466 RepID=A0AAD4SDN0_9MAGN|nr:hypothetical protein MKW98_027204 [Papaver atlanticum]
MERFSLREHVLLGSSSSPRRSSLSSPKLQSRNSDVDFNDVFGGPPRRSSMHEWRNSNNSLSDTINSNSSAGDDEDDENIPSRNPWSGLSSEKPVFGEETITRRNSPSKDFYDDIFKGDGLTTSTPTRLSWDHLHSNPASRVLSPARSMHTPPPQSDSFSGSSLPVLLSLPPKLAKGVDQAFSSPSHSPFKSKESSSAAFGSSSSPSVSRASTPVAQGQEELRNDVQHSYTRASSSRDFYDEGLSKAVKSETNSEVTSNSNGQFHFSIYKWPTKGVPLVMHLRGGINIVSKGKGKAEGIESELPKPVVQEISISSKNQSGGLNTITKDIKVVEEVARRKPVSEPSMSSLPHVGGNYVKSESADAPAGGTNKQGNDKMVKKDGLNEGSAKRVDISAVNIDENKKAKTSTGKKNINLSEASLQNSPARSETKNVKNKVKGKVKDFVKIFNQEVPVTHVPSVETVIRSQRTGSEDMGACKADDQENVVQKMAGNNEKVPSQRSNKVSVDTSSKDQVVEQLDKPRVAEDRTSYKTYVASTERNDTSTSCPEPIPVVVEAVVTNMEESHYEDLQGNCLVEVLPPEPDKQSEADQLNEEIKASDVKIRKWSSGKQGNIRSLLSTLQYVLWPGSGWKPVPLMDIIEQNSVRKAYQKALLCLHPDKLQQRGALPHQKYTAEKVFDILQEAWTQNNSVGAL